MIKINKKLITILFPVILFTINNLGAINLPLEINKIFLSQLSPVLENRNSSLDNKIQAITNTIKNSIPLLREKKLSNLGNKQKNFRLENVFFRLIKEKYNLYITQAPLALFNNPTIGELLDSLENLKIALQETARPQDLDDLENFKRYIEERLGLTGNSTNTNNYASCISQANKPALQTLLTALIEYNQQSQTENLSLRNNTLPIASSIEEYLRLDGSVEIKKQKFHQICQYIAEAQNSMKQNIQEKATVVNELENVLQIITTFLQTHLQTHN